MGSSNSKIGNVFKVERGAKLNISQLISNLQLKSIDNWESTDVKAIIDYENNNFAFKQQVLKFKLSKEHSEMVSLLKAFTNDILNIKCLMSDAALLKYTHGLGLSVGVYVCKLLGHFRSNYLTVQNITEQEHMAISLFSDNYRSGKIIREKTFFTL